MNKIEEPMRYNYITRLGNWYERKVLEEVRRKDYDEKVKAGELKHSSLEAHKQKALVGLQLSYSPDGLIHLGDMVMIHNHNSQGSLVNCIDQSNQLYTKHTPSDCRSVFRIMPSNSNDQSKLGDAVCFGQKVTIQTGEQGHPMYLASSLVSPSKQAKMSKKQEVYLVNQPSGETMWALEAASPSERFKSQNLTVSHSMPLLIKHVHTQQWLASDQSLLCKSPFGKEWEVYCHSHLALNKTQNLISEREGRTTTQEHLRQQHTQNTWTIITSQQEQQTIDYSQYQSTNQLHDLFMCLRQHVLAKHGLFGFRFFKQQLQQIGQDNNMKVDIHNFKWILINYEVALNESQLTMFMQQIDNDSTSCNVSTIIDMVIGSMSKEREQLVQSVYKRIQDKCQGEVCLRDIARLYEPSQDPHVLDGSKTEEQVFNAFMKGWTNKGQTQTICLQQFNDYYQDISAAMQRDDHFEYLITNAWNC